MSSFSADNSDKVSRIGLGRLWAYIQLFVGVGWICIHIVWNLASWPSQLTNLINPVSRYLLVPLSLDQNWAMFSGGHKEMARYMRLVALTHDGSRQILASRWREPSRRKDLINKTFESLSYDTDRRKKTGIAINACAMLNRNHPQFREVFFEEAYTLLPSMWAPATPDPFQAPLTITRTVSVNCREDHGTKQ
jgi:hypothetical protein